MAQETGTQILSYQGNPQNGLGSNSDIPAINPNANLDLINQTAKDVMLLDHANNVMLFQQKIKDRDELYKGLNSGEISTGKILEEDRATINKYKDDLYNGYSNVIKNGGFSNTESVINYKKKGGELKDATTQGQARYVAITELRKQLAEATLQKDRDAIQLHIDRQLKKPFWAQIDPYGKMYSMNLAGMTKDISEGAIVSNSGITTPTQEKTVTTTIAGKPTKIVVTEGAAPKSATNKGVGTGSVTPSGQPSLYDTVPGKRYSLQQMQTNARELFAGNPESNVDQTQWLNNVQNILPPSQAQAYLDASNARLDEYNQVNGIRGDAAKANKIKYDIVDPITGQISINESAPDFAAKTILAGIPGDYVEEDKQVFNKDAAKIIQDQKELAEKIRHNKATEGLDWSNYDLNRDKFAETTKGQEESKNAALVFAQNLFTDLYSKATHKGVDGSVILTPVDIRKLTSDQLKFLGKELPPERDSDGKIIESGGLHPLELKENEIIQVNPNGEVLIMKEARFDDKIKTYIGKWDNQRSTSVFNAARNVLNEENVKSGTKERNAYLPIDLRGKEGTIQTDVSGGGKTTSGSKKNISSSTIKNLVGKKGYEGYTEKELIDYYKSNGYDVK